MFTLNIDKTSDGKPGAAGDSFRVLRRSEQKVEVIDISDETSAVDDKTRDGSPDGRVSVARHRR